MTQRTSQQLMPPSQSDSPTERGGSGHRWIRACPWWNEYQFNNCRIAGLHPHSCQYEGWSKLDRCVVMIREKIITCAFPSLTLTIRDACYFLPSLVCCYPWTGVWASPPIPYPLTFFKYKVMYKMADKEMIRFAGTLLCRHHSLTFIFFIAIATSAQI